MLRTHMMSLLLLLVLSLALVMIKYYEAELQLIEYTLQRREITEYAYDETESVELSDLSYEELPSDIPLEHILQAFRVYLDSCPSPNGLFALPSSYSGLYLECYDNKMYVRSCLPGYEFNPETENCE